MFIILKTNTRIPMVISFALRVRTKEHDRKCAHRQRGHFLGRIRQTSPSPMRSIRAHMTAFCAIPVHHNFGSPCARIWHADAGEKCRRRRRWRRKMHVSLPFIYLFIHSFIHIPGHCCRSPTLPRFTSLHVCNVFAVRQALHVGSNILQYSNIIYNWTGAAPLLSARRQCAPFCYGKRSPNFVRKLTNECCIFCVRVRVCVRTYTGAFHTYKKSCTLCVCRSVYVLRANFSIKLRPSASSSSSSSSERFSKPSDHIPPRAPLTVSSEMSRTMMSAEPIVQYAVWRSGALLRPI